MKIGLVMDTTLDSNDGVQQYVKTLARWLINNGHEVKFLVGTSEDSGEFKGKIEVIGRNFDFKSNANKISTAIIPDRKKIAKLKTEDFDILHVQIPLSPSVSGSLISKTKIPSVATFHILPYDNKIKIFSKIMGSITQNIYKKFTKVMSVSSAASIFAKESYKLDSIVVPNMVHTEIFANAKPMDKYQDDKINILFLGRLVERKGAMYLLKSYKEILTKLPINQVRLIIAGKGYESDSLKDFVKEHNLTGVEFTGFVPETDKPSLYKSADICVFPATGGESFGIVLIEAMAGGKPVITFDNPGYSAVMEDTQNLRWNIKNKNTTKLGDAILTLVNDKNLRKKVGANNIKQSKQYDVDVVGKEILNIYKESI